MLRFWNLMWLGAFVMCIAATLGGDRQAGLTCFAILLICQVGDDVRQRKP